MRNLQIPASLPVVEIPLAWEWAQVNPPHQNLKAIHGHLHDWNLWDHLSILPLPTSLQFQWVWHLQFLDLSWLWSTHPGCHQEVQSSSMMSPSVSSSFRLWFGFLLPPLSTLSSSSLLALAASAVVASLMFMVWAVHFSQMHLKIWPWSVASSSFGGSGHTDRVYVASVSAALVWFLSGGSDFLQCGSPGLTFLSATLGQATAHFLIWPSTILHWFHPHATYQTHQDHPVMESNVVHERAPTLVRFIAEWAWATWTGWVCPWPGRQGVFFVRTTHHFTYTGSLGTCTLFCW